MISHKHKFILITPPKTAATSLSYALLKFSDIKDIYDHGNGCGPMDTFDYIDEFSPRSKHTTIKVMSKSVNLKEYTLIGSIRNPYDRVISHWKMHQRNNKNDISFPRWLQSAKIFNPSFKMVNHFSCNGQVVVDNFIRFESIQESFNIICAKIGLPEQQLPIKNKTKHKHYTEYYTDEVRQRVADYFSDDLEYFNYKFGD